VTPVFAQTSGGVATKEDGANSTSAQPSFRSRPFSEMLSDANSGLLAPGEDPENRLGRPFLMHLASDQKRFWMSPRELKTASGKAFFPFAAFTGLLIANDSWISKQVPDSPSQLQRSKNISDFAVFSLVGAAGGAFVLGYIRHNDHLSETGLLAGEAALNGTAVTYALKGITRRERPFQGTGSGTFFQGGGSFPSEHAALAWSVASVIAHEYSGPLTKFAAYGLASAVTITRVTGKQHFASEALIGSALGWYIGRQVYRAHHDPELGGDAWGDAFENDSDAPRAPAMMGSTYVPLDSWVYPALERLEALGYIGTSFAGIKPWTRLECARLTEEAGDTLARDEAAPRHLTDIQARLQEEFAYEFNLLDGGRNFTARVDSVYARAVSISGPALTDGYHFGQTLDYDFGRPFRRGTNSQIGASFQLASGPFAAYVRAEFQHAPSAPAPSDAVRSIIAERDHVPLPPGVPVDTINRPRLLDAYVAFNVKGWQISAGKQSLSWGPGVGGSLLWSNNAEPVTMVRLTNTEAFRLPSILKFLGPAQLDQFIGRLDGHSVVPDPFIYGQKINFKLLPSLELGFGRTVILGGKGESPFTAHNFILSFFGQQAGKGSVPGDAHSSMDWTFRVPKVRNYIVFYGEVYADDDFVPWQNPAKNPYRTGIYITRIPGLPKLDFHMEAASTESPGFFNGNNQGNLNYWNLQYPDGYTNNGNLIGATVGRAGRSIQCWFTYWLSPRNTVQFSYKHNTVSPSFIPQGGAWQDYSLQNQMSFRSGFYLKTQVQYEHISRYPILFNGPQRNVAAIVEFGFARSEKK
jgi:membrane-associated phospholipid phosphatase